MSQECELMSPSPGERGVLATMSRTDTDQGKVYGEAILSEASRWLIQESDRLADCKDG